ncbi:MAG: GNAT family N-acetyltransferase [Myxococcota bacterium]
MRVGVQRRKVRVMPARAIDRAWIFEAFDTDEIWARFGFDGPAAARIEGLWQHGGLVLGVIFREEQRVGFMVIFPPTDHFNFWELSYAIPDPRDRDAFTALNASDAMLHYLFDLMQVHAVGWRTQEGNGAADAIIRRIGYQPFSVEVINGIHYTFYAIDASGWAQRRKRLEAGEEKHPSGGVFQLRQ